jgi:hypothetical protein
MFREIAMVLAAIFAPIAAFGMLIAFCVIVGSAMDD